MNTPIYDKTSVRSLDKGLAVIEALNVKDGLTVLEISSATRVNRAIVYRLLETLRRRGYIRKGKNDHRYWLEAMVQGLSSGYRNEAWIRDIVQPTCEDLGRKVTWPINFTTYSIQGMVVRACSDYESPLTVEKIPVGYRIPLRGSTTGRTIAAFSDDAMLNKILTLVAPDSDSLTKDLMYSSGHNSVHAKAYEANDDPSWFEPENLERVRMDGYDLLVIAPPGLPQRTVMSVPVFDATGVAGVLSLRCYTRWLRSSGALKSYVQDLVEAAEKIRSALCSDLKPVLGQAKPRPNSVSHLTD